MSDSPIEAKPVQRTYRAVCILAVLLFILGVAGKFHFSSVGMWNTYLDRKDEVPGLLAGTPKYIRSDEWQLGVPWLLSQHNAKPQWPTNNPSVGAETSALLVGLPTKHWSTIFRPAHWGFFVFDFERGFSWLWMFRTVVLFFSLMFLCAQIGAGSLILGLIGAIWLYYSSFVQWWLASVAELLTYFSLACLSLRMVFRARDWLYVCFAVLSFLLFGVAFALVIYPPFQVPLVYLGLALLPFLFWGCGPHTVRSWWIRCLCVGFAAALGAGIAVAFLLENGAAVQLMSGTVYPGARFSLGGGMTLARYFSGFFDLFFRQDLFPAAFGNISETSSFIVLWPVVALCMPGITSRKEFFRCVPILMFLLAATAWAFLGVPRWLADVSGWVLVPTFRAGIAWGIGGVFLCIAIMGRQPRLSRRYALVVAVASALAICVYTIFYRQEVGLKVSYLRYVYAALVSVLLALAVVFNFRRATVALLCIACVLPYALVNPVMRGVSVLTDSTLLRAVQRFDTQKQGTWVVVGEPRHAQVVKAAGKKVINGAQYIPDLELWRRIDPQGAYAGIYNRYAHIGVRFGVEGSPPLIESHGIDVWQLTIDPCGGGLESMGITHLAWVDYDSNAKFSCLERVYVEKNIAVYKRNSLHKRQDDSASLKL
jgi:hypothetical protein